MTIKFPGNLSKKKGIIGKGNNGPTATALNPQQAMQLISKHVVANQDLYSDMVCKCGCIYFKHGYRVKHVGILDVKNVFKEPIAIHIQVWLCRDCDVEAQYLGPDANVDIQVTQLGKK